MRKSTHDRAQRNMRFREWNYSKRVSYNLNGKSYFALKVEVDLYFRQGNGIRPIRYNEGHEKFQKIKIYF